MGGRVREEIEEAFPRRNHSVIGATSATAGMAIADVALHLGPTGMVVAGLLGIVGWRHADDLLEFLYPDRSKIVQMTDRVIETVVPTTIERHTDQSPLAKIQRLTGIAVVREKIEEKKKKKPEGEISSDNKKSNKKDDIKTKLLPETEASPLLKVYPDPQDMKDIIEQGFKPSRNAILLMNSVDGLVTEPVNSVRHVALAGSTGAGKTNITRMLVSQLLSTGAKVYMANPNFAPVKLNERRMEDWRPIAERLQAPVARDIEEIQALFEKFMILFKKRRDDEQISPKRGSDVFLVVCELPAIVAQWKDVSIPLGRLLREARQYGIHVISEMQDALVATIGGTSGIRDQYGTCYFLGGGSTTANALLKLDEGERSNPVGLGDKGACYLRSHSTKAKPGRVPFFSNAALYMLLGLPAEPVTDDLVNPEDFVEEPEDGDIFASISFQKSEAVIDAKVTDKGPRAEDIDIDVLLAVWNSGNNSVRKLMKTFKFTNYQAQIAYKRIVDAGGQQEEVID